MTNKSHLLTLSDGRNLEIFDNGVESSAALLMLHGNPGVAEIWWTWLEYAASKGVRAIAVSRPGYFRSDRKEGRRVIDVNADWQELFDQCGVTEFVSIGWSAGSPYASASSFLNGNKGVNLVGAVASLSLMGAEAFGAGSENPIEDDLAAAASLDAALAQFEGLPEQMAGFEKSFFEDFAPTRDSYAANAEHYEAIRPHFAKMATDALTSPIGVSEDLHMIMKDWGFSPADVSASVNVWQGMSDRSTPLSHGEWLASNLGNAKLHEMAEQGHSTIIIECRDEIVDAAIEMLKA